MARVKKLNARKSTKRFLNWLKDIRRKSKQFRAANQAVMKSLAYAYVGRKLKKRDFRKLWITRINAAARQNGLSYSRFINGLRLAASRLIERFLQIWQSMISRALPSWLTLPRTGCRPDNKLHGYQKRPRVRSLTLCGH